MAGNAAVINTIALGILTLQQHPDQLAELIAHPELAPQVVNEICRYQTASALNCRRVASSLTDVVVGGQVSVFLASTSNFDKRIVLFVRVFGKLDIGD